MFWIFLSSIFIFFAIFLPLLSHGQWHDEEMYAVKILCYHHFVPDSPANDSEMAVELFRKQMAHIHSAGYNILSPQEFLYYKEKGDFPDHSVLLTFDDGYASFFHHAYPVLKQYNFPALVFPIVSHMEGLQRRPVYSERLTFHQMRLMQQDSGLIFYGSHSYDLHYYRDDDNQPAIMPAPGETLEEYRCRIRNDIRLSKSLLEAQLDQKINAFAWPYGITTDIAKEEALAAGINLLFILENRPFTPQDSGSAIPRYLPPHECFEEFKNLFPIL